MYNKKQSGFNTDFGNSVQHFVTDAARFIGIKSFIVERPAKSTHANAFDRVIPRDQRNNVSASSLEFGPVAAKENFLRPIIESAIESREVVDQKAGKYFPASGQDVRPMRR